MFANGNAEYFAEFVFENDHKQQHFADFIFTNQGQKIDDAKIVFSKINSLKVVAVFWLRFQGSVSIYLQFLFQIC